MMTYKKPVGAADSFLRPSRTYHDFEIESGINKKVNCLIGFAAVALVIALAALCLAVMLMLQVFQTAEIEVDKISVLQERIRILEEQIDVNPPIFVNGNPENSPTLKTKDPQNPTGVIEKSEDLSEEEVREHTQVPLLESQTVVESQERTEISAEDRKKKPIEDCPLYPRPVCPDGYILQNTDDVCPRPVCHPGDDEEEVLDESEGSGEECPKYPMPSCPLGYVVMLNDEPCPRPVCRKEVKRQ